MKINFYKFYLIKIIAPGTAAGKKLSENFPGISGCCNNAITAAGTIDINTNDAKHCDASFSFLPILALSVNELAPAKNINKNNFLTPRSLRIYNRMAMVLLLNLVFTGCTYALVTGPGAAWTFCRRITLTPATPSTDFQLKIALGAGQYINMNATGNDLRFYDRNNNICSYWIEPWNNTGTSTIWVKAPIAGVTAIYMYYGNAVAPATSNGTNTFDFFDDFTTPLSPNWTTVVTGGTVVQSGSVVTLSNTNGGTVSLSNTSAFTPSATSCYVETKHREVEYSRNRFYVRTSSGNGCPLGLISHEKIGKIVMNKMKRP